MEKIFQQQNCTVVPSRLTAPCVQILGQFLLQLTSKQLLLNVVSHGLNITLHKTSYFGLSVVIQMARIQSNMIIKLCRHIFTVFKQMNKPIWFRHCT